MSFVQKFKNAINTRVQGQNVVLSITGAAGSGKTFLAQECVKAFKNAGIYKNQEKSLNAHTIQSYATLIGGYEKFSSLLAETGSKTAVIVDEMDHVRDPVLMGILFRTAHEKGLDLIFTGNNECMGQYLASSAATRERAGIVFTFDMEDYRGNTRPRYDGVSNAPKLEDLVEDAFKDVKGEKPLINPQKYAKRLFPS